LFFAGSNTNKPFWRLLRWHKSPAKKRYTVIESKHSVIIFNIVVSQQLI
jgi:hypothetical protein